jgi:P4 family phage/plasmid primase-like protien
MSAVPVTPADAIERGWSIIPVRLDKKPCYDLLPKGQDGGATWKPYQTRLATADELSSWMQANPPAFAIATGEFSQLVTFDFDGDKGLHLAQHWGIRPHRRSGSGGLHWDVQHPGWYVPTLNGKAKKELGQRWPGLDVKGDGGYVVAFGRNEVGSYRWLRPPSPDDGALVPVEVWEYLRAYRDEPKLSRESRNGADHPEYPGNRRRVDSDLLIRRALDQIPTNGREVSGFWLAQQLRDNRYSEGEARSAMRSYRSRVPGTNTKGQAEPYTEVEMEASLHHAYEHAPREPWERRNVPVRQIASWRQDATEETPSGTAVVVFEGGTKAAQENESDAGPAAVESTIRSTGVPDLLHQPYTDSGNAERLVALYGRDIRFCPEMKKWLFWDGKRWNTGDTRRVKMLAKRAMRLMYAQAAEMADSNPSKAEIKKAAERHARASESAKSINAMLSCAEYEDGISVSANDLDQSAFLLNFLDCTFDLKAFEKRPHCREDLITKLVHFNYNPAAPCRLFLEFLHKIMGSGERAARMIGYLHKCIGSALTGDVSEKAVFCFFDTKGNGNNGKTTLLEIVRFVIEEYSAQILIDSLMAHHSRESSASLSDLADLRGNRYVTTSESEEGQRLAVGKLKYLTAGMGKIKTCRKYENPITFPATHKLFIDSNHRPVIRGAEKAVWNRLKPIPFTVTISPNEMDKGLLEKLKGEAEGILAWLVEGCRRWLKEGLGDPPSEVTEASAAWQAESDRFSVFLEDRCTLAAEAWAPTSQLWPAYQNWCEANAEKFILAKSSFDERLQALGCRQRKRENGTVRVWMGIRFRTPDEAREDTKRDNGTEGDAKCG